MGIPFPERPSASRSAHRPHNVWRFVGLAFALCVTMLVVASNVFLHLPSTSLDPVSPSREQAIHAQLRFLQEAIEDGAARDMQRIYPEGFFFQHVLTGLAWCDLAKASQDETLRREASTAARQALASIESYEGTRIFPEEVAPRYGVLWAAWTSLLRGRLVALEGTRETALVERWRTGLDSIAAAYRDTENPFQPSYEGMAWSGDNVMAMLALTSYDRTLDTTRYREVVRRWVALVRARLDPTLGMPPFELDHPDGQVVQSPRGSSQTLFAWAMTEIDTAFAREQYVRLRETFYTTRLGLPLVREFPIDSTSEGDYDSGPVIWGIGSSSTIVTLATARRFGDTAFARALEANIRFFGLPLRIGGHTRFALGQMPVADAWIAWARSSTPSPSVRVPQWSVSDTWRRWIHGISAFVILASALAGILLRRLGSPRRHSLKDSTESNSAT